MQNFSHKFKNQKGTTLKECLKSLYGGKNCRTVLKQALKQINYELRVICHYFLWLTEANAIVGNQHGRCHVTGDPIHGHTNILKGWQSIL